MMLCEEGKISLYDEVQTYLPEFRDQMVNANGWLKKPTRPIRIGDLLSHTSGMRQMPQGGMKDIHWKMDHTGGSGCVVREGTSRIRARHEMALQQHRIRYPRSHHRSHFRSIV